MGFIAFFISIFLVIILYPFALITSLVKNFYHIKFKDGLNKLSDQFMEIAVALDASGNVIYDDLFNLILIKKDAYKFGNRKETISSVLGKNKLSHKLTWVGWLISELLDLIDKDHCIKSIDNTVN